MKSDDISWKAVYIYKLSNLADSTMTDYMPITRKQTFIRLKWIQSMSKNH